MRLPGSQEPPSHSQITGVIYHGFKNPSLITVLQHKTLKHCNIFLLYATISSRKSVFFWISNKNL